MSTITLVPVSTPSFLNDINLYHQPLQHGLAYGPGGEVIVKPDLRAEHTPETLVIVDRLLAANRLSEANSVVGCQHMQNVTSYCVDNHEAEHASVTCKKPLLDRYCATPESRVHKFAYENPSLYAHLLSVSFSVVEFSCDTYSMLIQIALFGQFLKELGMDDGGWAWAWGYKKFFAVHWGPDLPYGPDLDRIWKGIHGPGAKVKVRIFDNKDGDMRRNGLLLAHSGFEPYWKAADAGEVDPLAISKELRGRDLTALYGNFRKFQSPGRPKPATDDDMPICRQCGKRHVAGHGKLILTHKEMFERFDHIRLCTYGQNQSWRYKVQAQTPVTTPSPPPW